MAEDFGIKISNEGFDVKTTEKGGLAVSSKYENLKVIPSLSGKKNVKVPSTTANDIVEIKATCTIKHNLGYVPFYLSGVFIPQFTDFFGEAGAGAGYFDGAINMIPFYRWYHYGAGVGIGNNGSVIVADEEKITLQYEDETQCSGVSITSGGYMVTFYYMIFANKLE